MPSNAELLIAATTAVNAATAAMNAMISQLIGIEQSAVSWSVWLDPVSGTDTNDGKTPATAVATLAKAVSLTPRGSYVLVNLMRDYSMDSDVSTDGRHVIVRGVLGTGGTPTTSQQRIFTQTVSAGAARLLRTSDGGSWQLRALDIVLAQTTISSGPAALFAGRLKQIALTNCGIRHITGTTTAFLVGSDGTVVLELDNVTALQDALAGRYIQGVSAATDPATLGKVMTNLATL